MELSLPQQMPSCQAKSTCDASIAELRVCLTDDATVVLIILSKAM